DLQDFVFWKHKKGCMVKIVQPANIVFPRNYFIQDDTTAIKTYIRNTLHIGETDKLCYVLLVGDENDVPMFNRYDYCSPNQYIWSDHYYACIEGTDSIADIAIGRLSVDNTSHVTTIVNKVFAYERNPAEDWAINRALMVSHYEEEGTYFGDTTQKIIDDILEPYNFDYYDADGRENWTNDDLKECIENNGSPYHAWIITLLSMIVVV
ncbi:hypothetical protein JXB22_10400, partial [candidate division WOR-3 bacterium]|nr:hypothetical protein [candidate division WOR-3 bacterium]